MANKVGYIFYSLRYLFLVGLIMPIAAHLHAQDTLSMAAKRKDTIGLPVKRLTTTDSVLAKNKTLQNTFFEADHKLPHSPRKAALYSAVLPGLGQIYNKEYWKLPLVYAALGTCTYFFIDNLKTYKDFRDAYRLRVDGNPDTQDKYPQYDATSLKLGRDQFREYVDYSVLFFVLAYGLNIADATVFAHLRNFDMSNNLSIRISPTLINNRTPGIGIQIVLKN